MRLIIGQLPIKAKWRDAHVAPWDLTEAVYQNIIHKTPILSSKFNPSLKRSGSV